MNNSRFRQTILVGIILLVLVIGFTFISRYLSHPTVTIFSTEQPIEVVLDESHYTLEKDGQKFVVKKGLINYTAANKQKVVFRGVINTDQQKKSVISIDFSKYSFESIKKDVCSGSSDKPEFCGQQDVPKLEYIDNNQWALITLKDGVVEAVNIKDKTWSWAKIGQADINSGQYPIGLEKAVKEYE